MVSNLDFWRAARPMVQRHGADAATEAAMRAGERLAAGDLDGQATWRRILAAIGALQRAVPGNGEAVH